ncbi:uncharacterized protein C2orf73 homolog isoform X1 [Myxocyprinus asiaticus]|uniref:uncharacterized protein C2orf73 homolog isoform X1 n=1 Tax=Myxocyprinus asiaticus TaxID=70543 RepID=UPI002221A9EE|nr:uncharacterized protein C2orf73 homolog isoform X1 [Myxocyprinus asiaticus]
MYHRAEIRLPRKKKVWESFHSNTFRIFDETLPERLEPTNVYQNHKYPSRDLQESEVLKTHNIPHPHYAKFIRNNVRFLNDPIAYMETQHTMAEQFNWWSNSFSHDVSRKAPHSKASTQRSDFQPIRDVLLTRVREADRPSATGIIPALCSLDQLFNVQNHSTSQDHMTTIPKKASQSVRVERWGNDGAKRIPQHGGVAFALGRDGKPAELLSAELGFHSADVGAQRGPLHPARAQR